MITADAMQTTKRDFIGFISTVSAELSKHFSNCSQLICPVIWLRTYTECLVLEESLRPADKP